MKKKDGFTILEMLFALGIIIPAIFAVIGINYYMIHASENARQATTALQDAHSVIEGIRNSSAQGLSRVIANYPNGQAVAAFTGLNLTNERITVSYANVNADPLVVTVTVTWTDPGGGDIRTRVLETQVTQR
ncbi:MAG: type II secretion system protein [Candidatus Omnitrophica bacterium]|nr:type II secretion system protein [Candidatus Omnitrophota bacterium]